MEQTIRCISLIILFLVSVNNAISQGKILIVGGGTESNDYPTSWNAEAYSWAVESSENKKVAVIHYSSTGTWLQSYFKDHCGAVEANNFVINQNNANDPVIMDQLLEHDVFFFRGGDQWYYYTYYNGTAMEETIKEKYDSGGVIAGTSAGLAILSGVIFYADNGSAYSDECIKNINHSTITLADDFFDFQAGYIFDSHFVDRGRMARLVAFMSNYRKNNGSYITGIGVDGETAFSINENKIGKAYGTGAVNIFSVPDGTDFGDGPELKIDSLEVTHLLHGDSIDLNTFEIVGLDVSTIPVKTEETGNHILYLSGSDNLTPTNIEMLGKLVNDGNGSNDDILIVTGTDLNLANQYKTKLSDLEATHVEIYQAIYENANSSDFESAIAGAEKIMFIDNSYYNFNVFRISGTTGSILDQKVRKDGMITAFIGDNARFAGAWVVGNYLSTIGSSSGTLSFSEGYNLLETTVIIPRTFEPNDGGTSTAIWHTTHAALPYTMVVKEMHYGFWLNKENYIIYYPENDNTYIEAYGTSPVMMLIQPENLTDLATQTYNGQPGEIPRMIAGSKKMYLSFLNDGKKIQLGNQVISSHDETQTRSPLTIWPNPAHSFFYIHYPDDMYELNVYSIDGRIVFHDDKLSEDTFVHSSNWETGLYIITIKSGSGTTMDVEKLIIY